MASARLLSKTFDRLNYGRRFIYYDIIIPGIRVTMDGGKIRRRKMKPVRRWRNTGWPWYREFGFHDDRNEQMGRTTGFPSSSPRKTIRINIIGNGKIVDEKKKTGLLHRRHAERNRIKIKQNRREQQHHHSTPNLINLKFRRRRS